MLPQHIQNLSDFMNFPADIFLFGFKKKTFALHHFLEPKKWWTAFLKNFQSKCLYICEYLRKKNFVPEI